MLKRSVMMFVCVAVALIAGSASALTPCNLSGPYVAVFTLVKPSLVSALGTFTFTPPADCSLPGTLSIDTLLGSASAIPYFVEGNELSIPGTPLDIRGLIGRTSPSDDGVAEGFVFHGFGVNTSFAGTALRSE